MTNETEHLRKVIESLEADYKSLRRLLAEVADLWDADDRYGLSQTMVEVSAHKAVADERASREMRAEVDTFLGAHDIPRPTGGPVDPPTPPFHTPMRPDCAA